MAFFTDYTSLQSTVASYLARTDLTTQIPEFIRLGETRLRRDLRLRQMIKVATAIASAGDGTVEIPDDFLAMKDLHIQGNPPQTIQFLANTPDLLLYAALGEAEPYLMNDERLQTWAAMYDRALNSITKSDDESEFPAQPMTITNSMR